MDLIQEAINKLDVLSGTLVEAEQKMENARLMLEQCLNHIQEQQNWLDEYSELKDRVYDMEAKVQSLELHNMRF